MSIKTQPMVPETPATILPDSTMEPESRCEMCASVFRNDIFVKLGWFQCSRQECNQCYPEGEGDHSTEPEYRFKHYDSLAKLEQSAENGCQLCRVLFMELVCKYREIQTWTTGVLEVWLSRPERDRPGGLIREPCITLFLPDKIDPLYSFFVHKDMRLTRQSISVDACLPSAPEGYSSFMTGMIDPVLEKINRQAIQPWMRICQQNHARCRSAAQQAFPYYPKRLVWVGNTTSDDVKLVETGEQCPPYLILSYCWGKSNDSAKTTEANYAERTRSIQISKLPKTIRDAIQLTRVMGEEYVWIDAMCIKQTDKGHTGDWVSEAQKVGDYYANAKCLISALSATESEQGFLGERLAWRYPQRYSLVTHEMTLCKKERVCIFALGQEQAFWRDTGFWQPLTVRGWCLQEQLLCPRRLHCTRNGLFWECNTVYASETQALSGESPSDADARVTTKNFILQEDKERALGLSWTAFVLRYSEMNFTMESDRLFAIHGIATRLARQHNEAYCAGIFGSYIVNGLMWHSKVGKPKFPYCFHECQDFPTWSWASASGRVSWPWEKFGTCQGPRCFIDLIRFPHTSAPDFTEMSSRELLIRAPLVKFFLDAPPSKGHADRKTSVDDQPSRGHVERIEMLGRCDLWEDLDLGGIAVVKTFVTDHSQAELKLGSVFLAAILLQGHEDDGNTLYGIILKMATVRNREVYTREGIFRVLGQDAGNDIRPLENRLWQSELTLV